MLIIIIHFEIELNKEINDEFQKSRIARHLDFAVNDFE